MISISSEEETKLPGSLGCIYVCFYCCGNDSRDNGAVDDAIGMGYGELELLIRVVVAKVKLEMSKIHGYCELKVLLFIC